MNLVVSRNQGASGRLFAFNVAARKIDTANAAIAGVRSISGAGIVELRAKDVFSMFPRPKPVVDDQRENNVARARFSISDVFAPREAPDAVTANAITWPAPISAVVPETATRLVRTMISSAFAHARRKSQRLHRVNRTKETDGLIDRAQAFVRVNPGLPWKNKEFPIEMRAQILNKCRVERRILPRQIHLTNHRASRDPLGFRRCSRKC